MGRKNDDDNDNGDGIDFAGIATLTTPLGEQTAAITAARGGSTIVNVPEGLSSAPSLLPAALGAGLGFFAARAAGQAPALGAAVGGAIGYFLLS